MSSNRSFISRILSTNPALVYLRPEDRYLTEPEQQVITCGVIGVGINGQEHLRNFVFEGHAAVKGFYDTSDTSAEAAGQMFEAFTRGQSLYRYGSIAELCSDPDIDAIMISTPNYTHIEVIREVVKYNKHILLEKPMATTVKDAWEICRLAENYPAVFQIGLQYRYKSIYREAIYEAQTRKTVGDVRTISISEHRIPFLDKVNQWNKFSAFSGGTLVEKCCHYFDLFNLFAASKPKTVYAVGSQAVNYGDFSYQGKSSDIIDNAFVIIEYENGVKANFNLCMFAPMFFEELTLCGDNGRLHAQEKQDFSSQRGLTSSLSIACNDGQPARNTETFYPAVIEQIGHHGATYFEHVRFIENIKGIENDSASVEEGFWAVVVGAAAQESIATGQPVEIDSFLEQEGVELTH